MSEKAEAASDNGDSRPHELTTFMQQDAAELKSEYDRIHAISAEDPGTAGDEGEEIWAEVLRNWLPESYQVVTKGRLLAADGSRGPQMDILVLRPGYPRRLLNKKLYLVAGVAAAFESKNTLKPAHLVRAFDQAEAIRALESTRSSTVFSELVPEVFFGVLAHTTSWSSPEAEQKERLDQLLQEQLFVTPGPRSVPSMLCVADLACWSMLRFSYNGPGLTGWEATQAYMDLPDEGAATLACMRFVDGDILGGAPPTPIAAAVASILERLSHDDAAVQPLAQYFHAAGQSGSASSVASRWYPLVDIYSAEVRSRLPYALTNGVRGSDWSMAYNF